MNDSAILRLEILEWWHCSAGRGVRSGANALAIRDDALPYVPGRTLKGLLRDAMMQVEQLAQYHVADGAIAIVPPGATDTLMGRPTGIAALNRAALAEQRFATERGLLHVGSATLPEAWRRWAATPQGADALRDLAETLHRTEIDSEGQAVPHSLRSVEVMPPMTLDAVLSFHAVHDPWGPQDGWRGLLRAALPLLRGLGAGRTRGLGRVSAELREFGAKEARA